MNKNYDVFDLDILGRRLWVFDQSFFISGDMRCLDHFFKNVNAIAVCSIALDAVAMKFHFKKKVKIELAKGANSLGMCHIS